MRKRLFAGVSAGLLALGMPVIAAPAQATVTDASKSLGLSTVVCTGEVDNTYSPGLDFTSNPTDLVIHENVTCTSILPLGRITGKWTMNIQLLPAPVCSYCKRGTPHSE